MVVARAGQAFIRDRGNVTLLHFPMATTESVSLCSVTVPVQPLQAAQRDDLGIRGDCASLLTVSFTWHLSEPGSKDESDMRCSLLPGL